jgi:regulator of replication initiation timing
MKLKQSFSVVKEDMQNLYEHIRFLYNEVEQLKVRNMVLMEELETLRKPKRRKTTKKRTVSRKKK